MKFPWQKGWREERDALINSPALEKAKKDLEELSKGKTDEEAPNAIDELEKSLKGFSDLENLEKSQEDLDKEKKEKEDGEAEEELEKARVETARLAALDLEKGGMDDLEQEMVRASLAFEGLTKSVDETRADTQEGMELLAKGLGSVTELLISVGNGVVALSKSLDAKLALLGAQPAKGSGVLLGVGLQKSITEDGGKTTLDEARTILIKAMDDGEVLPSGLLSRLDTKKDITIIPVELAAKLNIIF
jgi:hypothetical protein